MRVSSVNDYISHFMPIFTYTHPYMHIVQEKLLKLIEGQDISQMTLRQIGELVGESLPQKIKHHLSQLDKKGFITIDSQKNIKRSVPEAGSDKVLLSIPILGAASCGPATMYADSNVEGFLKISKRLVRKQSGIFAIKASGNSLNRANINGQNVESGDFLIIDRTEISPNDGDYILVVIDDMATTKKFVSDKLNERIALISESTHNYTPIFLHREDQFTICGKVIEVIKNI